MSLIRRFRPTRLLGVSGVLILLAAIGGAALATDHLLVGTSLVAKVVPREPASRSRVTFEWTSKDPAVAFPSSPPSTTGAVLVVKSADGDMTTVNLGSANWSESVNGLRAKYTNKDAPNGDSACKVVIIQASKLLKVICKSDLIEVADPGPEGSVSVRLTVGSDNYCASFGGIEKDARYTFVAKNAPAPTACDELLPTTTTTTTVTFCTNTTSTLPACGQDCRFGQCPGSQTCMGNGGSCGCVGDPVPCGSVSLSLCGLGDCPPGMHCVALPITPPDCKERCACQ